MSIYQFMFNSKPYPANPESAAYGGAYICCWVNSDSHDDALEKATEYCREEGWEVLSIEEDFIAQREQYEDKPEFLEFYDIAERSCSTAVS